MANGSCLHVLNSLLILPNDGVVSINACSRVAATKTEIHVNDICVYAVHRNIKVDKELLRLIADAERECGVTALSFDGRDKKTGLTL